MELPPLPPHLTLRTLQAGDFDKGVCGRVRAVRAWKEGKAGTPHRKMARAKTPCPNPTHTGFLQLLAQLTVVGDVPRATFEGEAG